MTQYRIFEDQRIPGPQMFVIDVPDAWDLYDSPLPQAVLSAIEAPSDHYRENVLVSVIKATTVEEVIDLGTRSLLEPDGSGTRNAEVMAEHRVAAEHEDEPTPAGFRTIQLEVVHDGKTIRLCQTHFAALLPLNFLLAVPRVLAIVATAERTPDGDPAPSLTRARQLAGALAFESVA